MHIADMKIGIMGANRTAQQRPPYRRRRRMVG